MKKILKKIILLMQGIFIPKDFSDDELLEDINKSLKNLDFLGSEHDKKNMKEDVISVNRDFNKSTREAKNKFELSL